MGFGASIKSVLSNYATFSGRARRSEFWWFTLFHLLIFIGMPVLNVALTASDSTGTSPLGVVHGLLELALILPSLAVQVRRLHDAEFSGWWLLIAFIPFVGALTLFVFSVMDGTHGPNKYGSDPKDREPQNFGPLAYS
ncbi:DUF805 domain-containing protein [Nocardia tengchongensis]|uniref:DUF805 domain-containing protein n=1 Tax=Nocardia tengchongensis TaxID=2055889 RepID=A0ABX8CVA8_9NOCA|nr:DUF805 domain-containing protein [Nocardia tengchongensis]QVI23818.1 DUF805 domain-containing protein [Nocardia tengchongensis]